MVCNGLARFWHLEEPVEDDNVGTLRDTNGASHEIAKPIERHATDRSNRSRPMAC